MSFAEEYDLSLLVNEKVHFVVEELERQLAQADDDICRCQDCVLDMLAYALNHIKPVYRVTLLGAMYAQADAAVEEIEEAVAQAIEKITENPSHSFPYLDPFAGKDYEAEKEQKRMEEQRRLEAIEEAIRLSKETAE